MCVMATSSAPTQSAVPQSTTEDMASKKAPSIVTKDVLSSAKPNANDQLGDVLLRSIDKLQN